MLPDPIKFLYKCIPEYFLLVLIIVSSGCAPQRIPEKENLNLSQEFSDYWFAGAAELTSYKLEQARYGEVHPGSAVLIFVTEDFSRTKQVKLDDPLKAGADGVKVLKLNATRNFNTGIYPYSMMASTFSPLNFAPGSTLKVTSSSQEWCGHTFTQLNNRNNQLEVSLKSYFETEGDQNVSINRALMEDEIWNMIRLKPAELPVGSIDVVPSLFYSRLGHRPLEVENASAELNTMDTLSIYQLNYSEFDRTLTITFNTSFPYEIVGWEESYLSGFGPNAKRLTTKAMQDKRIKLDYWSKNNLADSVWRKELNL